MTGVTDEQRREAADSLGAKHFWAVVELMGHRRLAGEITEVQIAGHGMLRLDIPDGATQFYSPSAVYCITPTTEEIARSLAVRLRPAPAQRWELEAPSHPLGPDDGGYEPDADAWAGG